MHATPSRALPLGCWIAAMGAVALVGCQDPTELDLEVSTNAVCADVDGTSISVGELGGVETADPVTSTGACDDATHRIGSLVVVPSGDDDGPIAVRIVTGIRRSPEACVANGYKGGCIVARRSLRYLPHTTLRLPIEMTLDCLDVPCGQTQTCVHGSCVSATIPDPEACATPGGCDLAGGDGGPEDGAPETSDDAEDAWDQDAIVPEVGPDVQDAGEDVDAEGPDADAGVDAEEQDADAAEADAPEADSGPDVVDAADEAQAPDTGPDVLEAGDAPSDVGDDAADTGDDALDASDDAADASETDSSLVCTAGTADCDGIESNGCEAILTDDDLNCGACGHDCFGGGCSAGACLPLVLATGQLTPTSIVVAGGYAYFTSFAPGGAVMRVPIDATGAPVPVVSSQPNPWGIATDGTFLFWTTQQPSGDLYRSALDGSGAISLAPAQQSPAGVLVDGANVYWLNQGGTVNKASKTGAGLTVMASGQINPTFIAYAAANIVVSNQGTKNNNGGIVIVPDPNGTPWNLTSGETFPMGVATDGTAIVWVTRGKSPGFTDGEVRKHSGGALTGLLTGIQDGWGVALDPDWIYWTSQGDGRLERVARDGTQRSVLVSGLVAPCGVAVDATSVYAASSGDGRILRIAK